MNWGPMIGLQIPHAGLRFWGSIILGGKFDPEQSGNLNVKFDNGFGYRLGGGLRVAMVGLNLEFQKINYDSIHLEQVGPFGSDLNAVNQVALKNQSWVASVSLPLPFEI
jgi:hypothetical protein